MLLVLLTCFYITHVNKNLTGETTSWFCCRLCLKSSFFNKLSQAVLDRTTNNFFVITSTFESYSFMTEIFNFKVGIIILLAFRNNSISMLALLFLLAFRNNIYKQSSNCNHRTRTAYGKNNWIMWCCKVINND